MNIRLKRSKVARKYLNLANGKAAVLSGQRGTVVRAVQGRLWLTQDGDAHDYVVPEGTRFCVANRGRIVVSAIDGDSRIAVYRVRPVPSGLWSHNAVRFDIEFIDSLENAARQAMAETTASLARNIWRRVRDAWRRFLNTNSAAPTLRMREGS